MANRWPQLILHYLRGDKEKLFRDSLNDGIAQFWQNIHLLMSSMR